MSGENGSRELTIREISSRSGVSEGTLRMWETRYSFPTPQRLASGHRRYTEQDLEQVRAVVRARAQGLSLPTAIEHARTLSSEVRPSVYSVLRETFPYLQSHLMPKGALIALCHAIEDECSARAQRPLMFACFQHERHYRAAEPRWRDFSRTAERVVVLAEFSEVRAPQDGPVEIPIQPADPLLREWVLACEGAEFSACLAGWERPGAAGAARRFETIWTVEPSVVRVAARACCELTARVAPEVVDGLQERLSSPAPSLGPEARSTIELTSRMVLYAVAGGSAGGAAS